MGDIRYANEKFYTGVDSLAGDGPIRERILSAYMSFHPVRAEDFADKDMRAKYEEIMKSLTVVRDGPKDRGYVQNTLEKMTDEEAEKVSSLIVELAFNIAEACAQNSN